MCKHIRPAVPSHPAPRHPQAWERGGQGWSTSFPEGGFPIPRAGEFLLWLTMVPKRGLPHHGVELYSFGFSRAPRIASKPGSSIYSLNDPNEGVCGRNSIR